MEGDGSPLSSLCMVRAAELFPKPDPEKEDESLRVPFTERKFILLTNARIPVKRKIHVFSRKEFFFFFFLEKGKISNENCLEKLFL